MQFHCRILHTIFRYELLVDIGSGADLVEPTQDAIIAHDEQREMFGCRTVLIQM